MEDFNLAPVSFPIQFLGKKWSIEILMLLIKGRKRFSDFLEVYNNLSSKVLAERLKELYSFDLIDKIIINMLPLKVKYRITEKGRALEPVFYELARYSIENYPNQLITENSLSKSKLDQFLNIIFK